MSIYLVPLLDTEGLTIRSHRIDSVVDLIVLGSRKGLKNPRTAALVE